MYQRVLDLSSLSEQKSLFLFGPRSTGKSTLIRQQFPEHRIINLLKTSTFVHLSHDPDHLESMINAMPDPEKPVIIDEIQKIPQLLDEIHNLIETRQIRFILTGSSARKLRSGGVNLLAGRAWQVNLHPLCSAELGTIELEKYLLYGGLPQVITSNDPVEELDAYINTYLKEEITAEALVQNLVHFSSFLKIAAVSNTQQINFANISRDTGVPATSVRAWFDILRDSFIAFLLEPWRSPGRKSVATAKLYFFDIGVANFLAGFHAIPRNSAEFGIAFEHFIAMELRAYQSYYRIKEPLHYWRTRDGLEVDFILGMKLAIEVKASNRITSRDLRGLRAISEESTFEKRIVVCMEENDRITEDGILVQHWASFLKDLWKIS